MRVELSEDQLTLLVDVCSQWVKDAEKKMEKGREKGLYATQKRPWKQIKVQACIDLFQASIPKPRPVRTPVVTRKEFDLEEFLSKHADLLTSQDYSLTLPELMPVR